MRMAMVLMFVVLSVSFAYAGPFDGYDCIGTGCSGPKTTVENTVETPVPEVRSPVPTVSGEQKAVLPQKHNVVGDIFIVVLILSFVGAAVSVPAALKGYLTFFNNVFDLVGTMVPAVMIVLFFLTGWLLVLQLGVVSAFVYNIVVSILSNRGRNPVLIVALIFGRIGLGVLAPVYIALRWLGGVKKQAGETPEAFAARQVAYNVANVALSGGWFALVNKLIKN